MNFIRLVRKKTFFWSLKSCSFCKAELLKFHESSAEKKIEPEKMIFLQSHACMIFFKVSAQKKNRSLKN